VVSIGPDSIAYASVVQHPGSGLANAVVVSRSTDGGVSWVTRKPVPPGARPGLSTDKNSHRRPTKAAGLHGVGHPVEPTDNPDDNPHTAACPGPAYFQDHRWRDDRSQAKIIVDTKTEPDDRNIVGSIRETGTMTSPPCSNP
jgi:hypothetical protein